MSVFGCGYNAADKEQEKADKMRFLKKIVLFSIGWIVIYTIAMIIIFCIKDDYPEQLTIVTFAYFSIEIVVSAGIKIFETFKRKSKNDIPAIEPTYTEDYMPSQTEKVE